MEFTKELLTSILTTLPIALLALLMTVIYNEFGKRILNRDRLWIRFLVLWIGLFLFKTGLYTWAPGRLGLEIEVFEGLITLKDGALAGNMAVLLFFHAACIGLALLGHLWKAIRKKVRFSWKFVLLEIVTIALFILIGLWAVNKAKEMPVAEAYRSALMMGLGLVLAAWGYAGLKKAGKAAPAKAPAAAAPTTAEPSKVQLTGTPREQFEQVVAEKNRLTALGDYASQIPLLTAATELELDGARKARIWNYMGIAREKLKEPKKAEECYRTALLFDENNPSSHNNLALLYSDRGEHENALRHMEAALAEAKKRKQAMGVYYGNYALVTGKAGNRSRAEDYLALAKSAGYDDASIQSLRKQLKLK